MTQTNKTVRPSKAQRQAAKAAATQQPALPPVGVGFPTLAPATQPVVQPEPITMDGFMVDKAVAPFNPAIDRNLNDNHGVSKPTFAQRGSLANGKALRSRADFTAIARDLVINVGPTPTNGAVKEFSTGSVGWNVNAKVNIDIRGGIPASVVVKVAGNPLSATLKDFSTGSVGWNLNAKMSIQMADGRIVNCQCSGNIVINGSKKAGVPTNAGIVTCQVGINIVVSGSKDLPATHAATKAS